MSSLQTIPEPPDVTVDVGLLVSVVIPCLNERESIGRCVRSARAVLQANDLPGEVIVADNDSDDGSPLIAEQAGATVVHQPQRGYGSAYMAGFAAARGRYIVMADADLTYDFGEIPRFLAELEDGADMVIGDRMKNIQPGAMPWHHRYIGNPLLSGLLNLFYRAGIDDAHCGMRALRRDRLHQLDLRTSGMEFASEMVIRAARQNLELRQFAIEYHPREGQSKLSSMRDGWRHVRFLLVNSPDHLFILPGLVMFLVGALIELTVVGRVDLLGRVWGFHALVAGSLLAIVGTQVVALGVCAHTYASHYMNLGGRWFDAARGRFGLEHGLALGGGFTLFGLIGAAVISVDWISHGFGALAYEYLAVLAATLIIIGIEVFFTSFLISILGLRRQA